MRSITVIVEGGLQKPRQDLDGRTPWQTARCECAAEWSRRGLHGILDLGHGTPYAWNVLLAVLAGVPMEAAARVHPGPLAAAALGWPPEDFGWVGCAHLITQDESVVVQAPAADATWAETCALADALAGLVDETVRIAALSPGCFAVGFREAGDDWPAGTPVWFAERERGAGSLPPVKPARPLHAWVQEACELLAGHAINTVRIDLDQNPLNGLWLWGGGNPAATREALSGGEGTAWLTDDPLAAGLGRWRGANVLDGFDQAGVAPLLPEGWQQALLNVPRTMIYVRGGGLPGTPPGMERVRRLESLDRRVLRPLTQWLREQPPHRLLWVVAADAVTIGAEQHPQLPYVLVPALPGLSEGSEHAIDVRTLVERTREG